MKSLKQEFSIFPNIRKHFVKKVSQKSVVVVEMGACIRKQNIYEQVDTTIISPNIQRQLRSLRGEIHELNIFIQTYLQHQVENQTNNPPQESLYMPMIGSDYLHPSSQRNNHYMNIGTATPIYVNEEVNSGSSNRENTSIDPTTKYRNRTKTI